MSIKYSELRTNNRIDLCKKIPLASPFVINIELTNRCIFRCQFCPLSFSDYLKHAGGYFDLTMEQFSKICQQIKKLGKLKVLRFYNVGEPFLNKNAVEMIKFAVEMQLSERTEVTTNGALLTEEIIDGLLDSGLDYLRVSIYAIDQKKSEAQTGSKISVDQIYNNLLRYRDKKIKKGRGPFLYIKMIDTFDQQENDAFIKKYKDIADEIMLECPMNWNGYEDRDLLLQAYPKGHQQIDFNKIFPYRKNACPLPFYSLVINSDETVSVCCADWNKKAIVGNLQFETLTDIWNGKKLKEFQEMQLSGARVKNDSCHNCTYLYTLPDNIDSLCYGAIARKT